MMPEPTQDAETARAMWSEYDRSVLDVREAIVRCAPDEAIDASVARCVSLRNAIRAALRPTEPSHIKRVKVDVEIVEEFRKESAPVTFRFEDDADGDLQIVFTRHDCPTEPTPEQGRVEPVAWTLRFKPTGKVCAWVTSVRKEAMDEICVRHNENSEDAPYEVIPLYQHTERIDLGDGG